MNKEDREKLEDVAGFLQGWLAFKKPVPTEEVIKLHFDLVMEVLAKNNEALDLVIVSEEKLIEEYNRGVEDGGRQAVMELIDSL